jgi:flagellar protein FliO/FliZ
MWGSSIWLSLLWTVICLIVILGLAYWVSRYVARGGMGRFGPGRGTEHLRVLAQLTLGKEQRLALVQAGSRYFLLGVTQSQINTLAEFTREEAEQWQSRPEGETGPDGGTGQTPPSFGEALHRVLQERKGR